MTVHRTVARVDNELIYERERFLGGVTEATDVNLAVGNTAVDAGIIDGVPLTINLPSVAEARGKFYSFVGTVADQAGGGQLLIMCGADTIEDNTTDAPFQYLFYSDGRNWIECGGGTITQTIQQTLVFSGCCTGVGEVESQTVEAYRFLEVNADGRYELASEVTPNEDSDVIAASYYVSDVPDPNQVIFHPLGCQALIELGTGASLDAGDLVFCGADGVAIDITELDADDGDGTDYHYAPVGYVVAKLAAVEGVETATHVEVFMFPYGAEGDAKITRIQGENQT